MATAAKQQAASREAKNEPFEIQFEGLTLTLPPKLPFLALRYFRDDDLVGLLESIISPDQMEKVWALDIDVDRGRELMKEVLDIYGIAVGEAEASSDS